MTTDQRSDMLPQAQQDEIRNATDRQLAAIWNILTWNGLAVTDAETVAHDAAVRAEVADEMFARQGFRPVTGQRVSLAS